MFGMGVKNRPDISPERVIAFKRAASLDNGISISWLEQTWTPGVLSTDGIKPSDYKLLKRLGFKTIRLPVAFAYFEKQHAPVEKVLARIDDVVNKCNKYGFNLIIDYHYGNLNDDNYRGVTQQVISLWSVLARRYINISHDKLFFEPYNEPPHMNPATWHDVIYNIVTAIHQIDKQRTLIVGASNYNSIYELSRFVRLADENIIYTFHFYEPFLFTHQGAEWIGDQVATTGIPFPYNAENFPPMNPRAKNTPGESNYNEYKTDGNERSVRDKLTIVKSWAGKYDVPVICGEYGVYNKYADIDSRCRYIKAVRGTLKAMKIPGILWDYNTSFSIFNGSPSVKSLPEGMKEAIGYVPVN